MAQILVRTGAAAENLARAEAAVARAKALDCDFVVLPECLDFGWTNPAARQLATPIPGPFSASEPYGWNVWDESYPDIARRHRMPVIGSRTWGRWRPAPGRAGRALAVRWPSPRGMTLTVAPRARRPIIEFR